VRRHVAWTGEAKNLAVLGGDIVWKVSFGRQGVKWEDDINMELKKYVVFMRTLAEF
jgi:hypothetical protein